YTFLGITVCYFTVYSIPKELVQNVLCSVSENTSSSIICFDNRNKCIYVNDSACRLIGASKDELGVFEKKFEGYINEFIEKKSDYEVIKTDYEIASQIRSVFIEFQTMRDKKDKYLGCFFKMEDRTEEVKRFEMEKYRATHDSLTGLLNRVSFIEQATRILLDNPDGKFYVVASNVREFKLVNDLFGTKVGDMVLCKEADVLRKLSENTGVVAGRISGDRFALLIPEDYYDEEMAVKSIEDIERIMKVYDYKLRICMGVYEVRDHNENVQTMYDKACMVIDKTKNDYLKVLSYYDTSIMQKAMHEKNVINEFDKAIEDEQFKMYLQAQVDNEGNIMGGEALVRWEHPENGLIFPGDFIEILERTGHIYNLDAYIWEQAAKKLCEWKQNGITDKHISVNISAKDFYYMDVYKSFTNLVRKYDINPDNLKLEITETVLMHDLEMHLEVLDKLRKFGFQIGVDDFGSGYSSLNMLKDIKADVLKIDMVFLRETENHVRSRIILNSIIGMSKKLGMKVLTEGVEKEEQIGALKEMGCDFFQGYYFSKPICVEEFEKKFLYNQEGD
ncbi:MAG: sensor domain-containing phosphodiesterase, partial [Lachnospiraceae bacterium]|nr:sensor domain-containing phosphodiesterase [Lachnospiraceae bacterium]